MSHHPGICADEHTMTAWSTIERTNAAGERCFVMERHCTLCACVEESSAAITEPDELFTYAKILDAGSEPDD